MKAIILSIGKAVFWVLFVSALLSSIAYVVYGFSSWLMVRDGTWLHAAISTGITIGWIAFFIYIFEFDDPEDNGTNQAEALQKRITKQNDILDRFIKKEINKKDAMDALNELYTESIQLVKTMKEERDI